MISVTPLSGDAIEKIIREAAATNPAALNNTAMVQVDAQKTKKNEGSRKGAARPWVGIPARGIQFRPPPGPRRRIP